MLQLAESHKFHSKNHGPFQDSTHKRQKLSPAAASIEQKLKRKLDDSTTDKVSTHPNKKLQEFLDVMVPSAKSNTWSNTDYTRLIPIVGSNIDDDESVDSSPLPMVLHQPSPTSTTEIITFVEGQQDPGTQTLTDDTTALVSDADWLRSKTSRLLDLTDDVPSLLTTSNSSNFKAVSTTSHVTQSAKENLPDAVIVETRTLDPSHVEAVETILQSGRLFVRNLPYSATEDDIRQHFSAYGELEEVLASPVIRIRQFIIVMKTLIGTSYTCLHVGADPLESR